MADPLPLLRRQLHQGTLTEAEGLVQLTSCLTGMNLSVLQIKTKMEGDQL